MSSCIGNNICISPQGEEITETKTFNKVSELRHDFSGDLTIHISDDLAAPYAEVTGSKNLVNNLKFKERNDKLIIEEDRCIRTSSDIHIHLFLSSLNDIDLNGSGSIYSADTLRGNSLNVDLDGSGEIDLVADVNLLEAEINGSGDIMLSGKATRLEYEVRGSGEIDGYDLQAEKGKVNFSGSGSCKVNVSDELNAEISGSGNIYCIGNPSLSSNVTGSGSINKF